jgi:hypothetical protein
LPLCSGYVNNQHLGECVAASCSIGMTGTGLSCPAHTLGDENTCIVKHTDAEEVCQKTAGCDYIGVCSQFSEGCKSWNGRYTDSVQLSKAPLIHNDDWIACKPGTEPGAPSSDLGAYFLLLLALIGGAYVGGGVGLGMHSGRRRGKTAVEAHPHYERWLALAGLVSDGLHFTRSRGGARAADREALLPRSAQGASHQPSARGSKAGKKRSGGRSGKRGTDHPSNGDLETKSGSGESNQISTAPVKDDANSAVTQRTVAATPGTAAGGGGRWVHLTPA